MSACTLDVFSPLSTTFGDTTDVETTALAPDNVDTTAFPTLTLLVAIAFAKSTVEFAVPTTTFPVDAFPKLVLPEVRLETAIAPAVTLVAVKVPVVTF